MLSVSAHTPEESTTAGSAAGEDAHQPQDPQQPQQLFVPLAGVDVEQHCARGVGYVSDMNFSTGQFPDQPGIDCAKRNLPGFGTLACAFDMVKQPGQLGCGKIRVDE